MNGVTGGMEGESLLRGSEEVGRSEGVDKDMLISSDGS